MFRRRHEGASTVRRVVTRATGTSSRSLLWTRTSCRSRSGTESVICARWLPDFAAFPGRKGQFQVPSGIAAAGPPAQRYPAGGQGQFRRIEVDGVQVLLLRRPEVIDSGQ